MRYSVMRLAGLIALSGLLLNARAQDPGDAKAIIKKGIEAQGGAKNLEKLGKSRIVGTGSMSIQGGNFAFTTEVLEQQPDKVRTLLTIDNEGKSETIIITLNGDNAWTQVGGRTEDASAQVLAELKAAVYASRVSNLTPLLTDKNFTLKCLGETVIDGKTALGVHVESAGQPPVQLHFDKASGLLIKLTRTGRDLATGAMTAKQEQYCSDFKKFDGLTLPTSIKQTNNGVKVSATTITEMTFPRTFDAKAFAKPE